MEKTHSTQALTEDSLMTERVYEFNWDIIGDLQEGRPNLGDQVNLLLYRLMHYTFHDVMVKKLGNEESNRLFYEAGLIAGRFFYERFLKGFKDLPLDDFLAELRAVMDTNGIRFVRIDSANVEAGECAISIATGVGGGDFSSITLDPCDYDTGFAEGILSKYAGREVKATAVNTSDVQAILPNLGDLLSLIPYRMLQYTVRDVTEQKIGAEDCDQLFYEAGEVAGHVFFDGFMAEFKELPLNGFIGELQRVLKELGVGVLRVEKADAEKGEFTLTVSEDLDCSGLPDLGLEVCNYDEGFIAGVFFKYTGVAFKAKEVDCWCSGDRTCRFTVNRV